MLGHKSAKVTLDTYAALFPDDLDSVVDALERHRHEQLRDKQIFDVSDDRLPQAAGASTVHGNRSLAG